MKEYFFWRGRINRLKFLYLELLIFFLIVISAVTTLPIIYPSRYDSSFVESVTKFQLYTNLLNLPIIYFAVCFKIKRFHDLNKSGLNALWLLIPFVNIYYFALLLFVKGTQGQNKYGPDSLKESDKHFKESA